LGDQKIKGYVSWSTPPWNSIEDKFGQVKGDDHEPTNNEIHKHSKQQHIYALICLCVFHEFSCFGKHFLGYFFIAGPSLASASTLGDAGDPMVELFCHLGEHFAPPREAQASQKTDRKVPASSFRGFWGPSWSPKSKCFQFCKQKMGIILLVFLKLGFEAVMGGISIAGI